MFVLVLGDKVSCPSVQEQTVYFTEMHLKQDCCNWWNADSLTHIMFWNNNNNNNNNMLTGLGNPRQYSILTSESGYDQKAIFCSPNYVNKDKNYMNYILILKIKSNIVKPNIINSTVFWYNFLELKYFLSIVISVFPEFCCFLL